MGIGSSKYNEDQEKVRIYSQSNLNGNIYELKYGNYVSDAIVPSMRPDNVHSLTIPPLTSVKLYCGDTYDYGGKGAVIYTNVTNKTVPINSLPDHITNNVRSLSIVKHDPKQLENTIDVSIQSPRDIALSHISQRSNNIFNEQFEPTADDNNYSSSYNLCLYIFVAFVIIILVILFLMN